MSNDISKNVFGTKLELCCTSPLTGFYRDGFCRTGPGDIGTHVIAATVTEEFLKFTKEQGNDLQTPRPEFNFPGLKPGDSWCLCVSRWLDAEKAGVAPPVNLLATNEKALQYVSLEKLKEYQNH
jgi:uncharacterized protein (DUF2237 family)